MQEKIGRYNIVSRLGRGGMGSVYLASDPVLNRQVAIKMVDLTIEEASRRAFFRERLMRDAKAAALLSHPNVVGVYDVVEEGDSACVVMEYVQGESLSSYLDRIPIPNAAFTLSVLQQIASALDYTHSKGIIHRDIKPANVMFTPAGTVKVLDFGIARMSDGRTSTPTDVVMGTVEYMSPEQVQGETLDGRSDQFSMACVAYRMLTGRTLFGQQTMATLAYKLVTEMPPPPTARNASLPPGVDPVLNKALSKSPSSRFSRCAEFAEALYDVFADAPTEVIETVTAPYAIAVLKPAIAVVPAKPKRTRLPWLAGAACVIALAGGVAMWKPWSRSPVRQKASAPASPAQPPQTVPVVVQQPPAPPPATPVPPASKTRRLTAQAVPKEVLRKSSESSAKLEAAQRPPTVRAPEKSQEPVNPKPVAPVDTEELTRLYSQGKQQIRQGDFESAVQSFTAAIAISPDYQKAYFNRGLARESAGQFQAAIEDFSTAVKLNPQDVHAYVHRGICLVRTHQDDQAFLDFNRALEINPELPVPLNGRGGILLRRRNYIEAIRDFDAALRINPRFAPAYANRARAKRALGNIAGANNDRKKFEELKGERDQGPDTP